MHIEATPFCTCLLGQINMECEWPSSQQPLVAGAYAKYQVVASGEAFSADL